MEEQTGKELVHKITKLKSTLQSIQEYKGEIFCKLQTILREAKFIKNKQDPEQEGIDRMLYSLSVIEDNAGDIEQLLGSSPRTDENKKNGAYYKVNLRNILNFGILDIESEDTSVQAVFKGKLYEILHELVKKYRDDIKTSIPQEFRGYVNRKKLEKKLYGTCIGKNRLNSHITRMRTILMENGLTDTNFIKSLDDFVRLNIDSYDVSITTIDTD